MVQLTSRPDLEVKDVTADIGLARSVRVCRPHKPGLREFGVALGGAWATQQKDAVDTVLRISV